jgi:hypothetical protein
MFSDGHAALLYCSGRHVRFGSLADIRPQSDDVFTPEGRNGSGNSDVFACPEKQTLILVPSYPKSAGGMSAMSAKFHKRTSMRPAQTAPVRNIKLPDEVLA